MMCALFGAGGQAFLNHRAKRAANAPPKSVDEIGFWEKWSPLKQLSDQDYEKILEERLLQVEVKIALVDDHIKELHEAESRKKAEAAKSQGESQTSSGKA